MTAHAVCCLHITHDAHGLTACTITLQSVWSHLSNDAHPSQSRASLEKAGQALMQRLLSLAPQLLPLLPCKVGCGPFLPGLLS